MKTCKYLVAFLLAAILAGCVPTRYSWSPDGRWMTVISDSGLQIADVDGNLLPGSLPGVGMAAWFPDSNHLTVCRQIDIGTWDELVKYISAADLQTIRAFSARLNTFAQSYDWTAQNAGSWESFEAAWKKQEQPAERAEEERHDELGIPIAIYLRDHASESLRKQIPPARWQELAALTEPLKSLEICSVTSTGVQPGRQIMTSLKSFHDLRVSPSGAAVLVSTEGSAEHDSDLFVVPADGSRSELELCDRAAWYADWSPDGRDVLFIRANSPALKNEQRLGSLSRDRVVDEHGSVVGKTPVTEDLAGVMYSELSRVRCLKNGRIFFASTEVKVPFTSGDLPDRPQIFSIDPARRTALFPVLPQQTLAAIGDAPQYFEVSPDGQHLSIPDKTGKVWVVDLQSGAVVEMQADAVNTAENKSELLTIPQWRSNDELTFIAPGTGGQPSVQLYSLSGNSSKTLSAKWPAEVIGKKSTAPTDNQPPGGL